MKNLTFGLAIQNLGQEVKFDNTGDPLPLNIKTGAGYGWFVNDKSVFVTALDINLPRDNDPQFSFGAELQRLMPKDFTVALRGGYKTVSQEKLGGLSGLTAGAGVTWRQFALDFAWVPYGDLGDTFRYSMIVKF
jgi:hypothetical protein